MVIFFRIYKWKMVCHFKENVFDYWWGYIFFMFVFMWGFFYWSISFLKFTLTYSKIHLFFVQFCEFWLMNIVLQPPPQSRYKTIPSLPRFPWKEMLSSLTIPTLGTSGSHILLPYRVSFSELTYKRIYVVGNLLRLTSLI